MADADSPTIVLDSGSSVLRAGFAGDEQPLAEMPALLARTSPDDTAAILVGEEALKASMAPPRPSGRRLVLAEPVQRGITTDWDDVELLWRRAIGRLGADPSSHPVLLAEAPLGPKAHREAAIQRLFESFAVPSAYVANASVLSLYSSGRGCGVLVSSGDGVSHAEVIYEGYALPASTRRLDRAGVDVTDALRETLRRRCGCFLETPAERLLARQLKEQLLLVRPLDEAAEEMAEEEFQLPDGSGLMVRLSRQDRADPAEVLFGGSGGGGVGGCLQRLVLDAVAAADCDIRRDIWANVILSGGGTLAAGFVDRLRQELEAATPASARIRLVTPPERQRSAWIGGSILASLSTFEGSLISQRDYDEWGPGVVHRMCY